MLQRWKAGIDVPDSFLVLDGKRLKREARGQIRPQAFLLYREARRAWDEDLHFHDLRGTAVTRLALSGCTIPEIAAITGHSPRDIEAILDAHYLGGRVDLAEQAMMKLDARYGNGT